MRKRKELKKQFQEEIGEKTLFLEKDLKLFLEKKGIELRKGQLRRLHKSFKFKREIDGSFSNTKTIRIPMPQVEKISQKQIGNYGVLRDLSESNMTHAFRENLKKHHANWLKVNSDPIT